MKAWLSVLITTIVLAGCTEDIQGTQSFDPTAKPVEVPASGRNNLKGSVAHTDFAELVRTSVATSPTTAAGTANVLASKSRIDAEQGAFLPQIEAETSLTSGGDPVPILRLSQIIYDGGKVNSRVGLRQIEARQTWLSELSELNALSFEAIETIVNLDRNRRLEQQARQNLDRTDILVDDLQSRFDAGAGSVADLLAGQGRRSNAETELAQAQTEVELATANWVEVFGTRPGVIPTIPPAPALAGSSAHEMVERSPRLRTQVAVSQVRQQEVIVAERATRPTLSAILETDFDQGFIDDGAQARLGVTVPIYQGGSSRANVKTARANLQQSQADEEELRRELQRNLSRALEETNSIQRRLATARRAVEINEQALDAARGQFNIGRSTLVQILDALRELNLAQVRVIQLEAQARRAEYAVLAVTGDILDALGVAQPTDPTL
ncbi:TolC family protein [Ruegeria conchae]|uniref:Outer membrane protein TolC n=1 Tax=Ruegeria conchae TaxID=981384 RepID=A0A497YW95_9RHOB|nr:TolC family protein [Ruegeria conchae]RLJ98544.1 outer membrane protein TolC [Ruegeria conchae]